MSGWLILFVLIVSKEQVSAYQNVSLPPTATQLLDFKLRKPYPDLQTTTAGAPIDWRELHTINTDIFSNQFGIDSMLNVNAERIPERVVHAKGFGAVGYFEVTHDVSKYTKADVFNGIGKKTPANARFSPATPLRGGTDVSRDTKSLALKLYTKEGNLDFLALHLPIFSFNDPNDFTPFARAFRRNPASFLSDTNILLDYVTLRPTSLHTLTWLMSDYGIPANYRRADYFPIHTYEINNKQGDKYFVRFNFRTELGFANLTTAEAQATQAFDLDFYGRDLYNAIGEGRFPVWRLEMDVLKEDIRKVNFNPFDLVQLWPEGSYKTVQIGRLTLNENPKNNFAQIEQHAANPANLVPGIPGPIDQQFRARRLAYIDAHNYRLKRNHNKIEVNAPRYAATYTRDGNPPVRDNMKGTPNYYPNSFNGPQPTVDASLPPVSLIALQANTMDLAPISYFYNHILDTEAARNRLAANFVALFQTTLEPLVQRTLKLLGLVDPDLERRTRVALAAVRASPLPQAELIRRVARFITSQTAIPALENYHPLPKRQKSYHWNH